MATAKKGLSKDTKVALEVGAGVLAAGAAAAAGYYFYGDKNAKKHRASASKWATGMKSEVLKEAKKLKKIDQKQIGAIVDKAATLYSSARSVNKEDLTAITRELKKNWRKVGEEVSTVRSKAKTATTSAKKTATKAKNVVKKVTKKKTAPKKGAKKTTKRS